MCSEKSKSIYDITLLNLMFWNKNTILLLFEKQRILKTKVKELFFLFFSMKTTPNSWQNPLSHGRIPYLSFCWSDGYRNRNRNREFRAPNEQEEGGGRVFSGKRYFVKINGGTISRKSYVIPNQSQLQYFS